MVETERAPSAVAVAEAEAEAVAARLRPHFRRAMSRRRLRAAMEGFRERFVRGAAERGVAERERGGPYRSLADYLRAGRPPGQRSGPGHTTVTRRRIR